MNLHPIRRNAAHKVTSKKSSQRWENEKDVIERIVQLGKTLGHVPTLLDLYCAGFEVDEIGPISDLLEPLLASDEDAEAIPWVKAPLQVEIA